MKLSYTGGTELEIVRESGDPKFYGNLNAAGESNLLYFVKKGLNLFGFDLIKKRMAQDGHMVDAVQQYLRTRSAASDAPHICLSNDSWAICGLENAWNRNQRTILSIEFDIFDKQPDCRERAARLFDIASQSTLLRTGAQDEAQEEISDIVNSRGVAYQSPGAFGCL